MTESYSRISDAVGELRRQWRLKMLADGALLSLSAAAAAVIVTVATDNLLRLGTAGRLLMSALLWGTLGAGIAVLVVRRWLMNRRDDFFAAMVEQKHPELHNLLINALQLGRGSDYGSPRLIEAIVKEADVATADVEVADCLDDRNVKRAGLIAAAGAVLLAGYAALFTPQFANGLGRVLLPVANIAPYTATQVGDSSIKPGNTRVPEGVSVTIEARVTGVIPDTVQLFRRMEGKDWRTTAMQQDKTEQNMFCLTLPQVTRSFDYYIAAGDGRSGLYHIEVVKRPQVENLTLTLSPPAYVGKPPQQIAESNGDITGVAGTMAAFELKATKPLQTATLLTEGKQAIVMAKAGDDRTWEDSFVIWTTDAKATEDIVGSRVLAPTRYHIKLLDTEGYENAEPLWQSITLVKDQAPTVTIPTPGRDLQLRPDESVNLTVDAKDDYGIGVIQILYRVNNESSPRELVRFSHSGAPELQTHDSFSWNLADTKLESGDLAQYWAVATDRNQITGPGRAESTRYSIFILTPEQVVVQQDIQMVDFSELVEELLQLQLENRAQTSMGVAFETLLMRQIRIRTMTDRLARAMERSVVPAATMVQTLDELYAGLMADAIRLFEMGRDTKAPGQAAQMRDQSLPVQDKIIEQLKALLARLQRNVQARDSLRKLEKTDKPSHRAITEALEKMIGDLDRMLTEETELAGKFEKLPKHPVDEFSEESLEALEDFEEFREKWTEWAKGTVDELTKLPTGFMDDFGLRADVKRIFQKIEKKPKPEISKRDIPFEALGAILATKMVEDAKMSLPDAQDYRPWILEEPLGNERMNIPEMPLPDTLEDLIGDLLEEAEDLDEEAEDETSAWGDNLQQAADLLGDGPYSCFSAKGKTGNILPENMQLTGRAGDGRRGKSAGQMVGDTSRGLPGRKTPARVGAERYEPGVLKREGYDDPKGATGGGKKTGIGPRGLQGGTPPDFVRDMKRLSQKQAALREKAEQVARRLDTLGVSRRGLTESIELMKSVEKDLRDLRYEDAALKRRLALRMLRSALTDVDQTTGVQLSRARQLPVALREELLQAVDEGYPVGYEDLLKNYFRALSKMEQ